MNLIELVDELKRLNFESGVLNSLLSEVDDEDEVPKISIGSRVLIKWKPNGETKGRVTGIRQSDGAFYVHRDGYSGLICLGIQSPGLTEHSLENLSVGIYGKLDKRLWLTQNRILEIQNSIKRQIGNDSIEFEEFIKKLKS